MTIDEYVAALPEGRRSRFEQITGLIRQLYPHADASIEYKMPTYRTTKGWVSVASQKNYISVYTCSAEHLSEFKAAQPTIKTGKGCINFRDKDPLPLDDLERVIVSAMESDLH